MDNKRLMGMLGEALRKENSLWKPLTYKNSTNAAVEIGGEQRDNAVRWLAQLTRKFHFLPETLALSVTILDRFLQAVKARPKHLNCIGVASFYLAAKTVEEDPMIPGTLELVQESHCGCSMSEVLRMERCILDKLEWDLRSSTPLEFLHIFHALLMANYPHLLDTFVHMTRSRQLAVLTSKLQAVLMDARSLQYPPSTIALALLSLELEQFWPEWVTATFTLQKLVQVEIATVIECRELIASVIQQQQPLPASSRRLYVPSKTGITKAAKRKVEQLADSGDEQEQEDFYDGIKRLYNEEHDTGASVATAANKPAPLAVMTVAN